MTEPDNKSEILGETRCSKVLTHPSLPNLAVKCFARVTDKQQDFSIAALREPMIHRYLPPHPNIAVFVTTQCETAIDKKMYAQIWMKKEESMNLANILDEEDGDPFPTEQSRWKICLDLARALEHIHAHGIIHSDIKSANVLINDEKENDPVYKICDFGLSRFDDPSLTFKTEAKDSSFSPRAKNIYTVEYRPFEVCIANTQNTILRGPFKPMDIFALGCVFFEIWSKRSAYLFPDGRMDLRIADMKNFENGVGRKFLQLDIENEDAEAVIIAMVRLDRKLRPSAKQLVEKIETLFEASQVKFHES